MSCKGVRRRSAAIAPISKAVSMKAGIPQPAENLNTACGPLVSTMPAAIAT